MRYKLRSSKQPRLSEPRQVHILHMYYRYLYVYTLVEGGANFCLFYNSKSSPLRLVNLGYIVFNPKFDIIFTELF